MLELWGMQSTSSLPSLPGPLCPEVVAPDRILSMGQIELNCELKITVYMYKKGFDINNQQWLMCHKTKANLASPALDKQTLLQMSQTCSGRKVRGNVLKYCFKNALLMLE